MVVIYGLVYNKIYVEIVKFPLQFVVMLTLAQIQEHLFNAFTQFGWCVIMFGSYRRSIAEGHTKQQLWKSGQKASINIHISNPNYIAMRQAIVMGGCWTLTQSKFEEVGNKQRNYSRRHPINVCRPHVNEYEFGCHTNLSKGKTFSVGAESITVLMPTLSRQSFTSLLLPQ